MVIKRVIIASGNPEKLREIKMMFPDRDMPLFSMQELGIVEDIPETGTTFLENALQKAKGLAGRLKEEGEDLADAVIIADDTGLCIDFLNGEPGIYSARYGGANHSAEEKIQIVLDKLADVTGKDRSGYCLTAIACIFPDGSIRCAEGTLPCMIPYRPKGTFGYGYDPIVYIELLGKTLAEVSDGVKTKYSHRGIALKEIWESIIEWNMKCDSKKLNIDKPMK